MKMINRRKFLLTGITSFVAASVAPYSFANSFFQYIEPSKNKKMLDYFKDRLNHHFVAFNDDHTFGIKLVEVRASAHSNKLEQFELIFKTKSKVDKSGLFKVSKIGSLQNQLMRLDQRGERNNYSAIFNLLT
jgi:hypothetical protein